MKVSKLSKLSMRVVAVGRRPPRRLRLPKVPKHEHSSHGSFDARRLVLGSYTCSPA